MDFMVQPAAFSVANLNLIGRIHCTALRHPIFIRENIVDVHLLVGCQALEVDANDVVLESDIDRRIADSGGENIPASICGRMQMLAGIVLPQVGRKRKKKKASKP